MRAILTKVIPATSTKDERIKAYTTLDTAVTLPQAVCQGQHRTIAGAHGYAAVQLCKRHGWLRKGEYLIGGGTPEGFCFVFSTSGIIATNEEE